VGPLGATLPQRLKTANAGTMEGDEDRMQVIRWNGYPVPVGGWYVDPHGHRVFLRAGDLAPICPQLGSQRVSWRLIAPIPGR